VDWKLELIVVPVSDVDRAKAFYIERAGFRLDVDHSAGEDFRVVQLTPPGSACSIALMKNLEAAGSAQGLQLVVSDIDAAGMELSERGLDAGAPFHFDSETGAQRSGADPKRSDYNSFLTFNDPDGNRWLIQEVRRAAS
jgi:catechol 2,3-dioxygenase-like lactoylglutathione lyase family enzyme